MADQNVADVQSLLKTVQDLSERLIPRNQAINNEVSRIFNRGCARNVNTTSTPSTSSTVQTSNNAVLFSRLRHLQNSRRIGQSLTFRRPNRPANTLFLCDVTFLSDPDDSIVPRQSTKLFLTERGHVITAIRFHKGMSEIEVETTIHEAFGDLIPPLVDIEILHSVHHLLVKPVLGRCNQGLDGTIIQRLFKSKNTPIHVRPSEVLIPEINCAGMVFMHSLSRLNPSSCVLKIIPLTCVLKIIPLTMFRN